MTVARCASNQISFQFSPERMTKMERKASPKESKL
jgi:hypothetical protein